MSKGTKKDKKGDAGSALQQLYQSQKRQILDCQFTIRKLQQRLYQITQQNTRFRNQISESGLNFNEKVEELTIKNMANQKRLLALSSEKTRLQIENQQKDNRIKSLEKALFDEQQGRFKDVEECKKNFHFELAKYESQLSEYKLYMGERDDLEMERQQLREKIEIEKANKLREIADKERQKVQATDKLKDEMLHKINDMRKNMFSLKRDQLSTTTRLTMLQNHQLTTQLQYQSKQTEKLIFKNQQLQQKVSGLKQQLQIHKQVGDQLAKRSHFSKGVIQKLNMRINELQSQIETLKNEACLPQNTKTSQQNNKQLIVINEYSPQQKNLISSLQQQIQTSSRSLAQLYTKHETVKRQRDSYEYKLSIMGQKSNQLYNILYRYYDQVLMRNKTKQKYSTQTPDIMKQNNNMQQFDLKNLRQTRVDQWSSEDLTFTVQILLNIIQPYLLKGNVLIPTVKKNVVLADSMTGRILCSNSCKSLPKISTTQRKQASDTKPINVSIASKIVSSNLRQWGQMLKPNKKCISKKYNLTHSFRS